MNVLVERRIEQIQDGESYKGHVKIGDTKFDYELVFPIPIARLDKMMLTTDTVGGVRDLFQITVSRGNQKIELTDDEYIFFFFLLNEFAVGFYHSAQTRAYNEGILRSRSEGTMGAFDPTAPLSATKNSSYDFPHQIREMLNAPKFGCALKAV